MSHDMKVFGATLGINGNAKRVVIAARSRKEAGEALGLGSLAQKVMLLETTQGAEVVTAMQDPGTAYARPISGTKFTEWEEQA